jgi:heat-inducible transcriptional repressor
MGAPVLEERSREVLRSLIQLHIATGEPVGSETLSRVLNRSLSPATLRNIMADLERHGYLDHPHTSAGRIPTHEGYRVYVDSLLTQRPAPLREAASIDSELSPRSGAPAQILENASHVLSRLSRTVAFVLGPDPGRTTFWHIDLVRLSHPRVLVVMVSRPGIVSHRVIEMGEELTQDELQACANYLNANFRGLTLTGARTRLLELMLEEKALYDSLLQRAASVGEQAFTVNRDTASVYLDGTANILGQEFADVDRMRGLFQKFEEKHRLVQILDACLGGQGIRVLIGRENPDPDLSDMAVVP